MIDYAVFYRRPIQVERISKELPRFDILVSAFNSSDRVSGVFSGINSVRKIWLIHPEYQYLPVDLPEGHELVHPTSTDEVVQVNALLAQMGDLNGKSICVDITGFMRHVLVFLTAKFENLGLHQFTAVYSEPQTYLKQEHTSFSTTTSGVVRPVRGLGPSTTGSAKEFLILGVGYDDRLISEVANNKDGSVVFPVFAFPSLSPDMYQQSAIRAAASGEVALRSDWVGNRRFAPANDPFSTANTLSAIVNEIDRKGGANNIYLSPLSTKVQALGFSIYWLFEGRSRGAVSIIFPECLTYSRETSIGLKRLWTYTVELRRPPA
ncbi:hypothetical protein CLU95_3821 [Variovorax sp. 54]|uniref:hypothetical protein n=1 Tax=Variovorax sp. 54 TaxID=2035212 RepID=UPI000C175A62|nr:hypothetical protein [Variovorax sp. 54]PIF76653.1 hypothetical protein CLU95_3821 [Variovorax sp. 54]